MVHTENTRNMADDPYVNSAANPSTATDNLCGFRDTKCKNWTDARLIFLCVVLCLAACRNETDMISGIDAEILDMAERADMNVDFMDMTVDAARETAYVLPPLENPQTLTVPDQTGIAIQPALVFDTDQKLHLVYTQLSPESEGIFVQRYDEDGRPNGAAINLVVNLEGIHNEPSICALPNGSVVVVWSVDTQTENGANLQIRYRVLDENGQPLSDSDQVVHTEINGNHWLGSVTCSARNEFLIVGVRSDPDNTFGVFAKRYDYVGLELSEAITVNENPMGTQVYPVATTLDDTEHEFVVVYEDNVDTQKRISARLLDANGQPSSSVFSISAEGIEASQPSISTSPNRRDVMVAASINSERIGLFEVDIDAGTASYKRGTDNGLHYSTTIKRGGSEDVFTYLSGSGRDAAFYLGHWSMSQGLMAPLKLYEGNLPPYQTALAITDGRIATAVTERVDRNTMVIRLFLNQMP